MANSPTAQKVALVSLLPYIGVTSLNPQAAGSELEDIQPIDLQHCAQAMTAAFQEIWDRTPSEAKEYPGSGILMPPTQITLSAAQYNNTISSVTTWAPWMVGCTIKIQGDDQDNEIISQTALARPYMGASGSGIGATVYCDAIVLDPTIGHVLEPVCLPNQSPLTACSSRNEFNNIAGQPLVSDSSSQNFGTSFFYFFRKTVARPRGWFVEGFYDPTLPSPPRRLRFAPLPDQAYPVSFRSTKNPPRILASDIDAGVGSADVVVSMAGSSAVNGLYHRIIGDDIEGAPHYRLSTDSTVEIFTAADGTWIISNPGGSLYQSTETPYYPWLVSTWTVIDLGSQRLPTVTNSPVDPGKILPISDEFIESIFAPIALKWFSATPSFKNDSLRPVIEDRYQLAIKQLGVTRGQVTVRTGAYIS